MESKVSFLNKNGQVLIEILLINMSLLVVFFSVHNLNQNFLKKTGAFKQIKVEGQLERSVNTLP